MDNEVPLSGKTLLTRRTTLQILKWGESYTLRMTSLSALAKHSRGVEAKMVMVEIKVSGQCQRPEGF
jgi:hypothetical protein